MISDVSTPAEDNNAPKPKTKLKDWFPVMAMATAAFIFNTTEFAPIGLLSDIARDLEITEGKAGMLITIYAWVVALASLPLTLICGKIERRKLLMMLFVLFIGSHILSYFSTDYNVLMISRLGVACAHSVFWAIAAPLAVRIAPEGHKSTALSILATGTTIAMVLGLPLGRTIGIYMGWRFTFLSVAIVAFIVMIILLRLLPVMPSNNSGSAKSLPLLFKRPALIWLYVLTVIIVTAHFTGYSYIEPFLKDVAGLSANMSTIVLLIFGAAGIGGSILFSKHNDKYSYRLMVAALSCIFISLLVLHIASLHLYTLILLCVFWGIAMMVMGLVFQDRVIKLAPDATAVAMSIYSGIFNIGIGGGALVGGIVSTNLGIGDIGYVGAAIAIFAVAIAFFVMKNYFTSK